MLLYDPPDKRVQQFFTGKQYPTEEELSRTYRALSGTSEMKEEPSISDIQTASSLSKAKLERCLAVLIDHAIATELKGNRFQLLKRNLPSDELVEAGEAYKRRAEHAKWKLDQMIDYAERKVCRWRFILKYFGSSELEGDTCGFCDNCAPERYENIYQV